LCEAAVSGRAGCAELCRRIQQAERRLLFDYCYRQAVQPWAARVLGKDQTHREKVLFRERPLDTAIRPGRMLLRFSLNNRPRD
jgi:hypothetical protein